MGSWRIFREADPDAHIVRRRFGPAFEKQCRRPTVIACATWECQVANECRFSPLVEAWERLDTLNDAGERE
jgi:hypothetical protein